MLIYFSLSLSVFNSLYGFIKLHLVFDNALPNLFSSSDIFSPFCLGGIVVSFPSIHSFISLIFFKLVGILIFFLSISSNVLIISINWSLLIGSFLLFSNLLIYFSLSSSVFNSLYGLIKSCFISDNGFPNLFSSSGTFFPLCLGSIVVSFLSIHFFISLIFLNLVGILFLSISSTIFIISSISGRLFLYCTLSSSVFNSLYGFIKYLLIFDNALPNPFSSSDIAPILGGIVVSFLSIHSFISYIFSR